MSNKKRRPLKRAKMGLATLTMQRCSRGSYTLAVVLRTRDGKRQERFFTSREAAEEHYRALSTAVSRQGAPAVLELSLADRAEFLALKAELAKHGATLRDACAYYLAHLAARQTSMTCLTLTERLIAAKQAQGASAVYVTDLAGRMKIFNATFGDRLMATITTDEVAQWLTGLTYSPLSKKNIRRIVGLAFGYGVEIGACTSNPIDRVPKPKSVASETGVLTPEQCRNLLAACPAKLLPQLAIGLFTGIRDAELHRLTWSDVNLTTGHITVAAKNSKTAQRRTIEISPVLRSWLEPLKREGKLCVRSNTFHDWTAKIVQEWPNNAMRHSFASYHLAAYQDAGALALLLGHTSTSIIFKHYRALVSREDAREYFGLTRESVRGVTK